MAAPVSGPTARTSIVITSPMVNPAVLANGPRSSITVAKTAQTRKKVATASTKTAFPSTYPDSTLGVPPFTESNADGGEKYFRRKSVALRAEGFHRRGVEDRARDVDHQGHHDGDRQAVGEGDRQLIGVAGCDDRSRPEEDERERPDEFGNGCLAGVLHGPPVPRCVSSPEP